MKWLRNTNIALALCLAVTVTLFKIRSRNAESDLDANGGSGQGAQWCHLIHIDGGIHSRFSMAAESRVSAEIEQIVEKVIGRKASALDFKFSSPGILTMAGGFAHELSDSEVIAVHTAIYRRLAELSGWPDPEGAARLRGATLLRLAEDRHSPFK